MKRKEAHNFDLVCVAEITGAHGIQGMLKFKIFSDSPESLMEYKPLYDFKAEKEFEITHIAEHKNSYLGRIKTIDDRNKAEALKGTKLYIHKNILPEIDDEDTYYYRDLIGLTVKNTEDTIIGKVANVVDFGAGDLLEIAQVSDGKTFFLPFKTAYVPTVDIKKQEIIVIIPDGLL